MPKGGNEKTVVIVGAGFGGVRAALDLARHNVPGLKIQLISDKPHFEYLPTLYRVVSGASPREVCIPLVEIFDGTKVEVVEDSIVQANLKEKILSGHTGRNYQFDLLILALGSETAYFNISGLRELSFGFKSISEAMRLGAHLHEVFSVCQAASTEEKVCAAHLVIIGGGPSGIELAGELAVYTKKLAVSHNLAPSLVTIDLIEAAPRLLPALPVYISMKADDRLRHLGVNIFCNRTVVEEEIEKIYLKDMIMKTKTVIWTAGTSIHHLYAVISGLQFDKRGRVLVNEFLQPPEFDDVFIVGDAASTPYSGTAQTAIGDGTYVADLILRGLRGARKKSYRPRAPIYALPIGPGWAIVSAGSLYLYGVLGWYFRRLADLNFFLSILPWRKAILVFRKGKSLCRYCSICAPEKHG